MNRIRSVVLNVRPDILRSSSDACIEGPFASWARVERILPLAPSGSLVHVRSDAPSLESGLLHGILGDALDGHDDPRGIYVIEGEVSADTYALATAHEGGAFVPRERTVVSFADAGSVFGAAPTTGTSDEDPLDAAERVLTTTLEARNSEVAMRDLLSRTRGDTDALEAPASDENEDAPARTDEETDETVRRALATGSRAGDELRARLRRGFDALEGGGPGATADAAPDESPRDD